MGVRERERDAMMDGAVVKKRGVKGLPVEGDECVEVARHAGDFREERPLFRVVAGEELAEDDVPLHDEAEPHEEHRRPREAACLDVEVEEPAMTEAAEEAALGRVGGGREVGEVAHQAWTLRSIARPVPASSRAVCLGGALVVIVGAAVERRDLSQER